MLLTKTLPISFKTWHHVSFSQTGNSDAVTVTMQRAVSRLCTAFVSFFSTENDALKPVNFFPHPVEGLIDDLTDTGYPLASIMVSPDSKAYEWEFVCDGIRYPTAPVRTTVESYALAVQSLGLSGQTSHALALGGRLYETIDHVLIYDFEKILGSALSGKNIRGGSQLLLNLKGLAPPGIPENDKTKTIFLASQHDVILELSAGGGVTILE